MTEDWLAAWDAATEEERRLVLETLGKSSFVIAARRDEPALVVGAITYRAELQWAQSGSDYEVTYIDLLDVIVENGQVTTRALGHREELGTLRHDETFTGTEEARARRVAEEYFPDYPALSVLMKLAAAVIASTGGRVVCAPEVVFWPAVVDGERRTLRGVTMFRVALESGGKHVLSIDEVVIRDGLVRDLTHLYMETIQLDAATVERGYHDQGARDRVVKAWLERERRLRP